jgi:hypothetical protein
MLQRKGSGNKGEKSKSKTSRRKRLMGRKTTLKMILKTKMGMKMHGTTRKRLVRAKIAQKRRVRRNWCQNHLRLKK